MIVVIGTPAYRPGPDGRPGDAAGLAAGIARAAAAAGARVEVAGRVGADAAGDALLLALARAGVGHAAMLRDPSRSTTVDVAPPAGDGVPLVPLGATDRAGGSGDVAGGGTAAGPRDGERVRDAIPVLGAGAGAADVAFLDPGDIDLALGYLLDTRVVVVAQPLTDAAAEAVVSSAAFTDATLVAVVAPDEPVPASLERAIVFELDSTEAGAFATLVGRFAASLDAGTDAAAAFGDARASLGWAPVAD